MKRFVVRGRAKSEREKLTSEGLIGPKRRAEVLLVAEAVAFHGKLRRTPSVRHQWYWSVCWAA